jgi:hypothetical protein
VAETKKIQIIMADLQKSTKLFGNTNSVAIYLSYQIVVDHADDIK